MPDPSLEAPLLVLRNCSGLLQIFVEWIKKWRKDGWTCFLCICLETPLGFASSSPRGKSVNLALILSSLWEKLWGWCREMFPPRAGDEWAGSNTLPREPLRARGAEQEWWSGSRAVGETVGHSFLAGSSAQDKSGPWNSKWTRLPGWNSQGSTPAPMPGPGRHSRETYGTWAPINAGCREEPRVGSDTLTPRCKKHSERKKSHLWLVTLTPCIPLLLLSFSLSPIFGHVLVMPPWGLTSTFYHTVLRHRWHEHFICLPLETEQLPAWEASWVSSGLRCIESVIDQWCLSGQTMRHRV